MVKMVYIFEYFLRCKKIISFLELFSTTCFLCILQTRRNTSIPDKIKKLQHMTFVKTPSKDGKIDICEFFYQDLFHSI